MKKYISEYIMSVEKILPNVNQLTCDELSKVFSEFQTKILYFQHERLIHLIVTVLFALLEISAIYVTMITPSLTSVILCGMFLVLLVPYVMHYYFLENSVQKMYKIEDQLRKEIEIKNSEKS